MQTISKVTTTILGLSVLGATLSATSQASAACNTWESTAWSYATPPYSAQYHTISCTGNQAYSASVTLEAIPAGSSGPNTAEAGLLFVTNYTAAYNVNGRYGYGFDDAIWIYCFNGTSYAYYNSANYQGYGPYYTSGDSHSYDTPNQQFTCPGQHGGVVATSSWGYVISP
jgi:hypothetical protein